ncbi:MAG: hypothetical protein IKW99_02050 [Bacteroidales bacterium]|nr:hypothetical protein [Bacteroidales bacterium]
MKKIISVVIILAMAMGAFAQEKKIPQRLELAEIEVNDGQENLEVFNMPKDGANHYYLSVGHLGIGTDIVQVQVDPIYELFIPLGETVADAIETLKEIKGMYKTARRSTMEIPGCLALAFPNDNIETVKVTYRKILLSNMLEFSVEREGFVRATYVNKIEFSSLLSSVKFYHKIHKNEP